MRDQPLSVGIDFSANLLDNFRSPAAGGLTLGISGRPAAGCNVPEHRRRSVALGEIAFQLAKLARIETELRSRNPPAAIFFSSLRY
jgi:hypothetical protein